MGTAELKNKLIEIINTSDEKFLNMVNALQQSYYDDICTDFYDELPEEIKEILDESRAQARRGEVRSHKEVMADFRKQYGITG